MSAYEGSKMQEQDELRKSLSKQPHQLFEGEIKNAKQVISNALNEQIITPSGKHYPLQNQFPKLFRGLDIDRQEAEITLSYIRSAITLAQGSNDISAEIKIGCLNPIGISLNNRLVPVLQAEEEEIEKYLRGEENNYE